jgi:hypothetical protein
MRIEALSVSDGIGIEALSVSDGIGMNRLFQAQQELMFHI